MSCTETEARVPTSTGWAAPLRWLGRVAAAPFRALGRLIRSERAWFAGLSNQTIEEWDARQF